MRPVLPRTLRAVALLVAAGLVAVVAPAAASSGCPARVVDGPWTALAPPSFSVGPATVRAFDVAWSDPDVVLASNGREVVRSIDGGCTWQSRWAVPVPPPPDLPDPVAAADRWLDQGRVVQVALDPGGDPDRFVLLLHDASASAGGAARILLTDDGGRTVRPPTLPPAPPADAAFVRPCPPQQGCRLEVSRADGDVLHLTSTPGPVAPGVLWRSQDGGDTWEVVSSSVGRGDPWDTTFRGIAPAVGSPSDPDLLVAGMGCRTVERSSDGGRTWQPVAVPLVDGGMPVGIAVAHPPGRQPALAVVQHDGYCVGARIDAVHLSRDDGASWVTAALAGEDIAGVALDRTGSVAVVADETGAAWSVTATGRVAALVAPGGRRLSQPIAVGARDGRVALAADETIVLLAVDPIGDADAPARHIPEVDLGTCDEVARPTGSAAPGQLDLGVRHVTARGGEERDVPMRFHLPPATVPVDVHAVLDASGSMDEAIGDLASTVVAAGEGLAAERIDLHLGIAEFRSRNTVPYRRLLAVGPIDCRAPRALAAIRAEGQDETHLIALEQAVTGRGLPALGIPPGRDAGFRAEALRLVLHATDEPFTEGRPHDPTFDEVVTAFRRAGVEHVGVRVLTDAPVDTGATGLDDVREGLDRIGRAVGTLAPPGGLDCDGDGLVDVPAGSPVTCAWGSAAHGLRGAGLGQVLAQLVRGLVQPVEVRLEVAAHDVGARVIAPATAVDRRDGVELAGTLALACPDRGVDEVVRVRAIVGRAVVAERELRVTCAAPAAPAAPSEEAVASGAPPTGPALVPAPAPAVPPPPVPVPGAAAASAPSGASAGAQAAASAAVPVGAPAAVPADDPAPTPATTTVDRRDQPDPVVPLGAAGLLTATAVHLRPRARHQEHRS